MIKPIATLCLCAGTVLAQEQSNSNTNDAQVYAQTITYATIAALDWHSTHRGLRNHPDLGRESNPILACNDGREVCKGRYIAINAGVGVGVYLLGKYVTPKLPDTPRKIVNGLVWVMLGGRSAVVAWNYEKGSK